MACILARGFEHGSIYDFDYISSVSVAINNTTVRAPGVYSGYMSNGTFYGYMNIPATAEFYLQVAMYPNVIGTSLHMIKWKSGSTVLGSLYWDNTLKVFKLYTGDAGTLVATGTVSYSPVWQILELYIKINDSGTLTFRHNGIQDMTFSGDTKPGADTTVNRIEICSVGSGYYYVDDIIVNDTTGDAPGNTWPNGAYVGAIVPNGAGTTTQWTPSTGSNYACVDEKPPVTTDYVLTNTVDQIDSYAMENAPAAASVILGVEETIFAVKIGAPAVTTLKPLVRIGGTDYPEASGIAVGNTLYPPIRKCWALNPNTSAAWTVQNVTDLELGMKSAA